MEFIFSGLQVLTETGLQPSSNVTVANQRIHSISIEKSNAKQAIQFPENYYLVPGFIDLHVHGVNGADVMDANDKALSTISQALAKEGTTSFLATTMTASVESIEQTLLAVRRFMNQASTLKFANVLGVHLEGPFLSPQKIGAQHGGYLLLPDKKWIEAWQSISHDVIKLVTLAPELSGSLEFIQYLKQKKIVASIGHTNATYEQTQAAIAAGCSHITHLFNAMRGIHQREPGVVAAALLSSHVMAELIVDGVHVHPAVVDLAWRLKGKDCIALVTDAMRAKCMQDGVYDLGGQAVTLKNNVATLADGTLAGSVLNLPSAVVNMMRYTQCSFVDAVNMVSANPAKLLGIFAKKGSIAVGKDADLVVLDEKLNVVLTMCEGRVVWRR